jgi:hypothetical protein
MPDIVVVGPDGNRYVFPEGTSRDVMRQAMQKRFPQPQAKKEPVGRLGAIGAGIGEAIPRAIGGVIEFLDPQGRKLLTPQQQAAYQRQFENVRQQRPNAFTVGQVAGEVLATAPVIAGGGKVVEKLGGAAIKLAPKAGAAARVVKGTGRIAQQTGRAIQSGGTGVRATGKAAAARGAPVAATRAGRMALRVAGGAGSAAATAVLTDQDVLDAAASGALLPVVGTIARRGAGYTYDLLAGRLGELRAAEIMRSVIADKSSGIIDALKKAPKNVKANTAEFLASKGLLTPELAAATRIVSAGKYGKQLEQKALAAADERNAMKAFIRGGETQTQAMGNIAAAKRELQDVTAPMREENLMLADIGRTQIIPAERDAMRLRNAAASEVDRARKFLLASDEEAFKLAQMDDLGDAFNPEAINRQRGIVGGLEQRGGQAARRSLALGSEARAAEEVAANLRAQGLQPLDVSTVVGRLRTAAADAEFVNPARFRVLSEFANNLENRAARYGGVIDATGLYELRKNMGNTVADILGPMEPNALQSYTAQIIGETQPLIDEAITTAGGRGWREYLDTFAQGMRNIERSQFERTITKLPDARFAKVMAGEDPDFVAKFFGPGRFDINVEMMGPKLPTAQRLGGGISASRAVQQGGLEQLGPSQALSFKTGARTRVEDALMPGMNTFARTVANVTGRVPGLSGGGIAAERLESELANRMAEKVLRRITPALTDPAVAARLLQTGPSASDYLGAVFSERLAPQTRNMLARMLTQSAIRPSYVAPTAE